MSAALAQVAPPAPAPPALHVAAPISTSAPGGTAVLVDSPVTGDWGWRLVMAVLGPVAQANPDVALAVLRTTDDLVGSGHAWVQRLIGHPAPE
ncbi:hypothetical protein TEK04_10460 [Klenkia sp. LSe6-5]|uniref:Uncharacterized protein n=1 Tax=Klenkia sesuvii TaxID=3103137 RepID=A0ABU8DTW0_9ACTN